MEQRGLFIVFEGIDGAGTTTQSKLLQEWLRKNGHKVFLTCEPSNGPIGNLIRMILKKRIISITPAGEILPFDRASLSLLFAADRLDHYHTEINPLINLDSIVISDRYVLSSLAYQSVDCNYDWIEEINKYAPLPNLTIFIDVSPEIAMRRMEMTRSTRELFEDLEFQQKVYSSYKKAMMDMTGSKVYFVDGNRPKEEVNESIKKIVSEKLLS